MKLGREGKIGSWGRRGKFLKVGLPVVVLAVVMMGVVVSLRVAHAARELPCGTICQRMLSRGFPESSSVVDAAKRGDAGNNGDPRYAGAQCALWLAEVGHENVFRHVVTEDEYNRGQFQLSMYGWCATPGSNLGMTAINIQPGNDNGSVRLTANRMKRGLGINDTHVPAYVDIASFVNGAEVVQSSDGDIYRRELKICRCNGTEPNPSSDCFADVAADKNCGIDSFIAEVKMPGNTLKVNYVKKDNECYGRPGTQDNWTAGPFKDDDQDKRIANDADISELVAAGYTFGGMSVNRGNAWLEGDWVNADVTNGSAEVTLTFSKSKTGDECPCEDWVPSSYVQSNANYGKTELILGVRNLTVKTDDNQWHHDSAPVSGILQGEIYAKPTDHVQWRYCYFPGVQFSAFERVTKDNVDPPHSTSMSPTVNHIDNMKFSEAYSFSNNFNVRTEQLQPGSENVNKTVTNAVGNADVIEGFMPEQSTWSNGLSVENEYVVQQRVQDENLRGWTSNSGLYFDPGTVKTGYATKDDGGQTEVSRDNGATSHSWNCNYRYDQEGRLIGYDTCTHDDDSKVYSNTHSAGSLSDQARVYVPYNFTNEVGASLDLEEDKVLYSGETVTLGSGYAAVGMRQNEVTDGEYATEIEEGRARLVAFVVGEENVQIKNQATDDGYGNMVDDEHFLWKPAAGASADICDATMGPFNVKNRCQDLASVEPQSMGGTGLNTLGNMTGSEDIDSGKHGRVADVFDEAAGNYFCVAAAIYPYTVKNNTDMEQGGQGDHTWLVSKPDCRVIAKRPTFQVWGAGVYAANNVKTSLSVKNNIGSITSLAGYNWVPWYNEGGNATDTMFGSWTELSLTVQEPGKAEKMASGAGTGYKAGHRPVDDAWGEGNGDGDSPGGSKNVSFCLRSSLSIANNLGTNGSCEQFIGLAETSTLRETLENDRNDLANRFPVLDDGDPETDDYQNAGYRRVDGQTVRATEVGVGETLVNIVEEGDITITGDIKYAAPAGGFTDVGQVPKYIIYARNGDIKINCKVARIDAILMASGEVKTCDGDYRVDGSGSGKAAAEANNDPARRWQLVINGAVVTGAMKLPRSFGAGTGVHSITPAELIDYDSSIYLWANTKAQGAKSGVFTEKASRELAPRY